MKISKNINLAPFTSLRVGGPAENLIELEAGDELQQVLAQADLAKPVWILGGGTNCLISDVGLPGTVIINRVGSIQIMSNQIKVSSGYIWDEFIKAAIAAGLWGLEFTSGIPGDVGAAIAGNIAAYGHQVADHLTQATVFDLASHQTEVWPKSKFNFSYRSSVLQLPANRDKVILEASFELSNQPTGNLEYASALKAAKDLGLAPDSLANRRQIILEARRQADALLNKNGQGPWTAGSFFRNPLVDEKQIEAIIAHEEVPGKTKDQILQQNKIHGQNKARISAAHVLLAAGFRRGQTWGKVRLDPDHVLKVENTGGATAQEIYDVVQNIISTVHEKLNVKLEPEVRFLGKFS